MALFAQPTESGVEIDLRGDFDELYADGLVDCLSGTCKPYPDKKKDTLEGVE
jgi:hypothetical protein